MLDNKGHPNRLGVWGWLGGGRWGFERYLYTLHRLTGLGLLFYFLLHIFVTSARAFGSEAWAASMGASAAGSGGLFFTVGEFLVFARSPSTRATACASCWSNSAGPSASPSSQSTRTARRCTSSGRWRSASWCWPGSSCSSPAGYDFFILH